ncbi:MAG: hypothetical protein J6B64_02730 [Bacilli bacterium]|nr:hypothetical protein [Bacilli bacterium]MBP3635311.1 hypothetical protein [Bacilli bacterium]
MKEDYIFTEIFNKEENIYVLEWFISTYLNEKIKGNIKILSRKLNKENNTQAKN